MEASVGHAYNLHPKGEEEMKMNEMNELLMEINQLTLQLKK